MDHPANKMLWLRDYFTDAEIQEYKSSFLKKYFKKGNCEQGKAQKLSREGKRQRSNTIKECAQTSNKGKRQA